MSTQGAADIKDGVLRDDFYGNRKAIRDGLRKLGLEVDDECHNCQGFHLQPTTYHSRMPDRNKYHKLAIRFGPYGHGQGCLYEKKPGEGIELDRAVKTIAAYIEGLIRKKKDKAARERKLDRMHATADKILKKARVGDKLVRVMCDADDDSYRVIFDGLSEAEAVQLIVQAKPWAKTGAEEGE